MGFWEPVRLADVSMKPWCFVNLGGLKLDPGFDIGFKTMAGPSAVGGATQYQSQWHVHWYAYPLIYWMELVADFLCLESGSVDILYITEIDPLWQDSELTAIINPEAVLFANPLALAACAADCVLATTKLPSDSLFWCAGCQGSMYPLNGNVSATIGHVQASRLALSRFAYKLHRELVAWGTMGGKGLCGKYLMPVMRKQQYRFQATNPNPQTKGRYACAPDRRLHHLHVGRPGLPRDRRGHGLPGLAQTELLRAMKTSLQALAITALVASSAFGGALAQSSDVGDRSCIDPRARRRPER
jgi:conjugal transfer pilus assembly protein TraU